MLNAHQASDVRTVALILAGGVGQRAGTELPKQYVVIKGQSIIQRTVCAFMGYVDHILVAAHDEWRDQLIGTQDLLRSHDVTFSICPAGKTGFESLCSGIHALAECSDDTFVIIHDAVRPLVTGDVIERNIAVARQYGNAIASVDVYETLLSAPEGDGVVRSMTRREGMFRAQTPHTFRLGALRKMLKDARRLCIADAQSACVLAQQLGYELHLSPGDLRNFKITTPSDLQLYEALIP